MTLIYLCTHMFTIHSRTVGVLGHLSCLSTKVFSRPNIPRAITLFTSLTVPQQPIYQEPMSWLIELHAAIWSLRAIVSAPGWRWSNTEHTLHRQCDWCRRFQIWTHWHHRTIQSWFFKPRQHNPIPTQAFIFTRSVFHYRWGHDFRLQMSFNQSHS